MAWTHEIFTTPESASYWNAQSVFSDTTIHVAPSDTQFGFSIVQLVFTRGGEDSAIVDFAFTALPGGGITSVLDPPTHMVQAETELNQYYSDMQPYTNSGHVLSQYRWYQYHATTTKPGPAVRVTSVGLAGGNPATALPYQVAATTTYRTSSRRHWGRHYWPGLVTNHLSTTGGRFTSSAVDGQALAAQGLVNRIHGHSWGDQVVASRQYHGILAIASLDVDDVPDIQRRRRVAKANYEKVYTS